MKRLAAWLSALTFCLSVCSCGARAEGPHGPLTQSELLALVAGAALPENIVVDIRERGLSFAVDATYRALMPEKLEPYERQLIAVLEKQFGPNSPQLAGTLDKEAQTLRTLGRTKEAAEMDERLASIRSLTMQTH